MSTLVIQIPPRPRSGEAVTPAASMRFGYALSPDGLSVARQGRTTRDLLPRADTVVAVLADGDVSWHQVKLPKAPQGRLAAALTGLLEDALLDETEAMHLAVGPQAQPGQTTWVAATHRAWLSGVLNVLEAAVRVDRVVPAAVPEDPPAMHFHEGDIQEGAPTGPITLTWCDPQGVLVLPLHGALGRALLPQPLPAQTRITATPAAATTAERWLGSSVTVVAPPVHLLAAARNLWNLRQFELAPRHRGLEAVMDQGRRFMGPRWRPARLGLAGLVIAQIVGLNLWAWNQSREVSQRKLAMEQLLRDAHPQVRAILDAPAQMQRETETLRAAAGETGDGDLEALLRATASAWPSPDTVQTLQYDNGRLTIAIPTWTPAQIDQVRSSLAASGLSVQAQDGRLVITPALLAPAPAAEPSGGART